jgi:DNA modification methylase
MGKDDKDAQTMLDRYLEAKGQSPLKQRAEGYIIQDKYYHNIYIGRTGRYLCGVIKIKDGFEKIGEKYLTSLMRNLETQ